MCKEKKIKQLAKNILCNSIKLQKGEKVFLEMVDPKAMPLFEALVEETVKLGGIPFYYVNGISMTNAMLRNATEEQIIEYGKIHEQLMLQMDAWVGIRNIDNPLDDSEPGIEKVNWYQKHFNIPVHMNVRCKLRWCLLRYPNSVWAYEAGMSTKAFEDFYFNACLTDYTQMAEAARPLLQLMQRTDKVRIVTPNTDLRFSIKNIGAVPCFGSRNIPDGEIYSAPVVDSVEGHITFNVPTSQAGKYFSGIHLEFSKGRVINANASVNNDALQKILSVDEGNRRLGEFALGLNPFITTPMGNTLFDEKIAGSIHLALGNCLSAANGNHAPIHWDLVQIQTPEYGGGEIWFDDVLIRKDGRFVVDELTGLNPENLQ